MQALVYEGPREVVVEDVPDARIERPTDVLVRVTTANICGSDLHMYEGRTNMETGRVLGHENLGEVIEVGSAVDRIKWATHGVHAVQHRVRALQELRARAHRLLPDRQPGRGRGRLRLRRHGAVPGGQAELLRVPYGDFNCLRLPGDARRRRTTT